MSVSISVRRMSIRAAQRESVLFDHVGEWDKPGEAALRKPRDPWSLVS
jgi:hypothetical protein